MSFDDAEPSGEIARFGKSREPRRIWVPPRVRRVVAASAPLTLVAEAAVASMDDRLVGTRLPVFVHIETHRRVSALRSWLGV
jgi:hypothetical protein